MMDELTTLKNQVRAANMTISELRAKLSKAEHDRNRYKRKLDSAPYQKVKLGQEVYCIYDNSISKSAVYAIGKDFFINGNYDEGNYFNSWFYYFDEYGETWFTSFKEAKKALEARCPEGKFKKIEENYWEII